MRSLIWFFACLYFAKALPEVFGLNVNAERNRSKHLALECAEVGTGKWTLKPM